VSVARRDPFAELVRQVAAEPDNAYSIDRYLWVLEEAQPVCGHCGAVLVAISRPPRRRTGESRPPRYRRLATRSAA